VDDFALVSTLFIDEATLQIVFSKVFDYIFVQLQEKVMVLTTNGAVIKTGPFADHHPKFFPFSDFDDFQCILYPDIAGKRIFFDILRFDE
jgi:hypothetical protein